MEKEYDTYLVIGSFLISFLTSFLAIAFASFIVWHKKNSSSLWLIGAALNMGLGVWAMHFVGMLALHIDVPVAFEPVRTILSALVAIMASYIAFWILLSADFKSNLERKLYGSIVLGSGVALMHYLGMDAMQMFPKIAYDPFLFTLSLFIAYIASFVGLSLFILSSQQEKHSLFSKTNLLSSIVIGLAVTGMHYTGMAAAEFDYASYCTVLDEGLQFGVLSTIVIASIIAILLLSFMLLAYEQSLELKEHKQHKAMLDKVTIEVEKRTAELQRQTEMNDRLLETMDAIIIVLDSKGFVHQFNLAAQKITGYSLDDLKGKHIWDILIPAAQKDSVQEVFSHLASGMFPNKHQNDWVKKDGGCVTIDWHNSALVDEHDNVVFVIGTGIDVTETLKAQEALTLSAVAFETQEAMVVTDSKGVILKVNQAFEEITGYPAQEIVGQGMSVLKSGKHGADFYKALWESVEAQSYWQGEIWNRRKNGEIFPEWLRITQVLDADAQVVNYIGNFSDISQRKKLKRS